MTICPSNVLAAVDDMGAAGYNRRKFAAVMAFDDEAQRYMPGGEEPIQKKLEKRG